jgi:hypothetical protein
MIKWALTTFPRKEFLVWRWIGDYLKGILDGIRAILSDKGFTVDEISSAEGRDTTGEEGTLV